MPHAESPLGSMGCMTDPPAATLAILAGGRGSRMGGTKDRLAVGGRPILLHLLSQARHDGPTMLVTSPEHPRPIGWDRFDRVAFDPVVGEGPLAGLLAGLKAAATPVVCFLSVDMPGVGAQQLQWLRVALVDRPTVAGLLCRRHVKEVSVGAVEPIANPSAVEPFPSAFRVALALPILTAHWEADRRSLRSLLDLPSVEPVDVPSDWSADVWANLNRPSDLTKTGVKMG